MNKIRKCLFPVAGYGTRFLPATKSVPKEMFPILDKPLLQYGVEEAINSDIDKVVMVTNKYKDSIKKYFEPHPDIEESIKGTSKKNLLDEVNRIIEKCEFSFIEQPQMLGLGNAIHTGELLIGNEPFAVILPDDLCYNNGDSVLKQMVELYEQYPDCCIIAIEEVPRDEVDKYGIVSVELISDSKNVYRVNNMIEKPHIEFAPSNLAIIGRYIFNPEIFGVLRETIPDENGEVQITDALLHLAKKGKVIAYKFIGERYDCGNVDGFVKAINQYAKLL